MELRYTDAISPRIAIWGLAIRVAKIARDAPLAPLYDAR
jgi:hypothetical protein